MFRRLIVLLVVIVAIAGSGVVRAQSLDDVQRQIRERQQRVEELKRQAAEYEANLQRKRRERLTLSNQIGILTERIEKTKVEIAVTQTSIEGADLEIRRLEQSIRARELDLARYRQQLGALIRWLARSQERGVVQVFFTHPSFADFYDELRYLKTVQGNVTRLVGEVEAIRMTLTDERADLEARRHNLAAAADTLSVQQLSLEGQQETKAVLLQETRSSEQRFAVLLEEAKREQEQTSREITNLEQVVRERLRQEGISTNGERPALIWPLPNSRGLSAVFHDTDYPFRRVFEHSGIDIRAYQRTPVRAAASGYVGRVQRGGARGYGYVLLVHNGGLATVYGHVSQILVAENTFVAQGEVIAYSGGLPGTPGAGPFTTGPHLHFETRMNGIPVNPQPFLP